MRARRVWWSGVYTQAGASLSGAPCLEEHICLHWAEGTKEFMSAGLRAWRKTAPWCKGRGELLLRTISGKDNTAKQFHRAVKKLPAGAGDFLLRFPAQDLDSEKLSFQGRKITNLDLDLSFPLPFLYEISSQPKSRGRALLSAPVSFC